MNIKGGSHLNLTMQAAASSHSIHKLMTQDELDIGDTFLVFPQYKSDPTSLFQS